MKRVLIYLSLVSATFFTALPQAMAQPGAALNFGGTTDFVSLGSTLGNVGAVDFTIELKLKTSQVKAYILSKRNICGSDIFISVAVSDGKFTVELQGTSYTAITGTRIINDNNWHHVAWTRAGGVMDIYVDGVLDGTGSNTGNVTNNYTTTLGKSVCTGPSGSTDFNGEMDELRIWGRALRQFEIQNNMNCELGSGQTNLTAYYQFNQGIAGGSNSCFSMLTPAVGTVTGKLTNFTLGGTTSNWVAPGGVITGVTCPAMAEIVVTGNGIPIPDGDVTTATLDNTDFGNANATVSRPFMIENTGTSQLTVSSIVPSGTNAGAFTVRGICFPATIAGGANTPFTLTFTPAAAGVYNATVTVNNSDADEAAYDFAVRATNNNPSKTWTNGAGTGLWSTANNWNPAGVPGAGDSAMFDGTSSAGCTFSNAAVAGLIIKSTYGGVLSLGAHTLSVSGRMFVATAAQVTVAPLQTTTFTANANINCAATLAAVVLNGGNFSLGRNLAATDLRVIQATAINNAFVINVTDSLITNDTGSWTGTTIISMTGTADQALAGGGALNLLNLANTAGSVTLGSNVGVTGALTGNTGQHVSGNGNTPGLAFSGSGTTIINYQGDIENAEFNHTGTINLQGDLLVTRMYTLTAANVFTSAFKLKMAGMMFLTDTDGWSGTGTVGMQSGAEIFSMTGNGMVSNLDVSGSVGIRGRVTVSRSLTSSASTTGQDPVIYMGAIGLTGSPTVNFQGAVADMFITNAVTITLLSDITISGFLDIGSVSAINGAFRLKCQGNIMSAGQWSGQCILSVTGERFQEMTGQYANVEVAKPGGTLSIGSSNSPVSTAFGLLTATSANGADIEVNGQVLGGSVFMNGGRWTGSGLLPGSLTVSSGVSVAPGDMPLTFGCPVFNSLAMNSGSVLRIDINSTTECIGYDLLSAASVSLNNPTLALSQAGNTKGTRIIVKCESLQGTFNGLPEGATVMAGSNTYKISYVGGDGNDVSLTPLP